MDDKKATPKLIEIQPTEDSGETQSTRNARKLMMAIGDANGMPDSRCVKRLARLIPKTLAAGGQVPPSVRAFIEEHELGDDIKVTAAQLAEDEKALDGRARASMQRNQELRDDQLDRREGKASDDV